MQKLLFYDRAQDFDTQVNYYLSDGWVVVPGTIAISDGKNFIVIKKKVEAETKAKEDSICGYGGIQDYENYDWI